MLWIGITGSMGTGKTTFAELLRKQKQMVLDADELAKAVLAPDGSGFSRAVAEFGSVILNPAGHIDRAALANVVFSDKVKLEKLEAIIHPEIRITVEKIKTEQRDLNRKFLFYDVPLLFEKKMEKTFDLVVMVTCRIETQIKRIKQRNSQWSDEDIRNRLAAQLPLEEKESKAHVVINNDGDKNQLQQETEKFLSWLETIQNQD
ncbi:MAG: dephospho-CoA kinase [Bdellovibrionaceae bacterium]|nr:dephospho-CoA kinase [Pseudobdellovibrionaceae bacterium]